LEVLVADGTKRKVVKFRIDGRTWLEVRLGEHEILCGAHHVSIEEAIVHAEQHLGSYRKPMDPYFGTMRDNAGVVVGFELSATKRWRLDFDPNENTNKGVHVNEENYGAPGGQQKVVHLVVGNRSYLQVHHYYHKWTARYGMKSAGA
jgi:hypothetical protein